MQTGKYRIMMMVRSNTLNLNWRNWGLDEEKKCNLCENNVETLSHFLFECSKLQERRNFYKELQLPQQENMQRDVIPFLLLFKKGDQPFGYYIDVVYSLWKEREDHIKNLEVEGHQGGE